MAKRDLKRLDLDKTLLEKLSKNNLHTCQDILSLTRLELLKLLGISDKKTKELVEAVSKICAPKVCSAFDLYQAKRSKASFLSLFIPQLDNILCGGLPIGNVTEIAGPSGVGKTQFCFMLSVLVTLPVNLGGLDAQVIFIDTESTFCAKRLMAIAKEKFPNVYSSQEKLTKLMQRVFVYSATSTEALKQILQKAQWDIIRTSTKLVIIDSIASLVRKEFSTSSVTSRIERTNLLVEQAALLKNLAESLGIVVVVTNQITSFSHSAEVMSSEEKNFSVAFTSDQERVAPALGVTWAHCVNTRFVAEFINSNERQLLLAKSALAPCVSVSYTIQNSGIVVNGPLKILSVCDPLLHTIRTKYQCLDIGTI